MDAKLKALKVVDLKDLLAKAHVAVPAKTNKADLIARVLAAPAALALYSSLYEPAPAKDDLLAPPEDVDWNTDEPSAAEPPSDTAPPPSSKTKDPAPSSDPAPLDPEAEKRRQRAARFGIPLVDPPKSGAKAPSTRPAANEVEDPEKLKARAARFGISKPATAEKRAAPVEDIDAEELQRRIKRAERFGTKPVVVSK